MTSFSAEPWLPPPNPVTLTSREIHVWRINLEPADAALRRLRALLSPDEQTRADRFYFERDRRHFIAARGTLRRILGGYLRLPPERLQFQYADKGKPSLSEATGGGPLQFNLSHSHQLGLCAVVEGQEVGVDLEHLRPLDDAEQIAERFFSANENVRFRSLPADQRVDAFFNCWTRKEAYIKAFGDGLSYPLDRFDVSLAPGDPARFLSIDGSAALAEQWWLHALAPGPGYVGALAIQGHGWRVSCWQAPDG